MDHSPPGHGSSGEGSQGHGHGQASSSSGSGGHGSVPSTPSAGADSGLGTGSRQSSAQASSSRSSTASNYGSGGSPTRTPPTLGGQEDEVDHRAEVTNDPDHNFLYFVHSNWFNHNNEHRYFHPDLHEQGYGFVVPVVINANSINEANERADGIFGRWRIGQPQSVNFILHPPEDWPQIDTFYRLRVAGHRLIFTLFSSERQPQNVDEDTIRNRHPLSPAAVQADEAILSPGSGRLSSSSTDRTSPDRYQTSEERSSPPVLETVRHPPQPQGQDGRRVVMNGNYYLFHVNRELFVDGNHVPIVPGDPGSVPVAIEAMNEADAEQLMNEAFGWRNIYGQFPASDVFTPGQQLNWFFVLDITRPGPGGGQLVTDFTLVQRRGDSLALGSRPLKPPAPPAPTTERPPTDGSSSGSFSTPSSPDRDKEDFVPVEGSGPVPPRTDIRRFMENRELFEDTAPERPVSPIQRRVPNPDEILCLDNDGRQWLWQHRNEFRVVYVQRRRFRYGDPSNPDTLFPTIYDPNDEGSVGTRLGTRVPVAVYGPTPDDAMARARAIIGGVYIIGNESHSADVIFDDQDTEGIVLLYAIAPERIIPEVDTDEHATGNPDNLLFVLTGATRPVPVVLGDANIPHRRRGERRDWTPPPMRWASPRRRPESPDYNFNDGKNMWTQSPTAQTFTLSSTRRATATATRPTEDAPAPSNATSPASPPLPSTSTRGPRKGSGPRKGGGPMGKTMKRPSGTKRRRRSSSSSSGSGSSKKRRKSSKSKSGSSSSSGSSKKKRKSSKSKSRSSSSSGSSRKRRRKRRRSGSKSKSSGSETETETRITTSTTGTDAQAATGSSSSGSRRRRRSSSSSSKDGQSKKRKANNGQTSGTPSSSNHSKTDEYLSTSETDN